MSVKSDMYHIRSIFECDQKIILPNCMYTMKNLHHQNGVQQKDKSIVITNILEQEPLAEVAMLESQQEDILKKLAALKEQIERFRSQLNQPVKSQLKSAAISNNNQPLNQAAVIQDIVIYADPKSPPYGLLAVQALSGSLCISSHAHSSLRGPLSPPLCLAFNSHNESYQLHVTLVWKYVGQHPKLVLSPTKHAQLQGEVNVLRLLSRLGIASLSIDHLSAEEASVIDWALDTVYQLAQGTAPRQKLQASLARLLPGPSNWLLVKSGPTILDIALWSYFKGKNALNCPAALKDWMQSCNKIFS